MDSATENLENTDSVFVWDENSQLYFHSSSGFYHDPNAGWYYSSRDGLYYKFEDGNYVPLGSNNDDCGETHLCNKTTPENPEQIYDNNNEDCSFFLENKCEAYQQTGTSANEAANDSVNSMSSPTSENPPPPSEWLEDTLIELYLSGYNNAAVRDDDTAAVPVETDDGYNSKLAADAYRNSYEAEGEWIPDPMDENGIADKTTVDEGIADSNTYELEEGEWIPDPEDENDIAGRTTIDEGILLDEERWQAQYGQVTESEKDLVSEFQIVDLWDWEMVRGSIKDGKDKAARLVGRLVKQSAKTHPSIPSSGGKLRSAPICEVHLNLVRVKTGQVYKLRNPSARYMASLSTYDSANPTKDWDFPQLSSSRKVTRLSRSSESTASASGEIPIEKALFMSSQLSASKQIKCQYRDRAAARRILHGGYGKGPGQKNQVLGDDDTPSSPFSDCPQQAASEALEMSFGVGSYARKLLENMGWKEGEGLGRSTKGLVEPIQPAGNIGSAGLGWPRRN
ncbi:PREDICTED: angiogenic factor with G patch and FHA domains 1 isoform X2 [Lupinus angustifolius]|uniref:angiogenic factor with G patch and FHA domains 1 isoform X2 n=1 Tax=Lupinus angustifolius TaxID=3871 RepID=UPI00092E66DD|nr:PREDICTED: angiogenic factor with G patch and FHA domains 1 isoform X2 [Lupinus angustifolius]